MLYFLFPLTIVLACKNEHPWNWVASHSHFYHDSVVATHEFRHAIGLLNTLDHFSDCPIGRLTLLLLALPAVDVNQGREFSTHLFNSAKTIRSQLQFPIASELPWLFDNIDRHIQHLDNVFFSQHPVNSTCFGLKFYIYDQPERLTPRPSLIDQSHGNFFPFMLDHPPINCHIGMWGTEIVFPSLLRSRFSQCLTRNAAEADFFIVPSYFKCIYQMQEIDKFGSNATSSKKLLNDTLAYLGTQEPWRKNAGADHVFLFSWGQFPCALETWNAGQLKQSVFLQVENVCTKENVMPKISAHSPWKDVLIPGLVDSWRIPEINKYRRPARDRKLLLAFHGRTYGADTAREQLVKQLKHLPGTSIGGFTDQFHQTIGNSRFCLVARGVTAWSLHLFVNIFAGCIPVVASDDIVFPFDATLVDVEDFIVRWPERGDPLQLYTMLQNFPEHEYLRKFAVMEQAACWFDYFSDNPDCSAMVGIFHGLKKKQMMRNILSHRLQ